MQALDLQTSYHTATIADINVLLELIQEFHEFEDLSFDESIDRDVLEQLLKNDSLGKAWLIYEGSNSIGYVIVTFGYSIEFRGREACIDELYLKPVYRRHGIGTKTLQFVEEVCRSLNIKSLNLEVACDNYTAQKVYQKSGYDHRGYYLMTKPITISSVKTKTSF